MVYIFWDKRVVERRVINYDSVGCEGWKLILDWKIGVVWMFMGRRFSKGDFSCMVLCVLVELGGILVVGYLKSMFVRFCV